MARDFVLFFWVAGGEGMMGGEKERGGEPHSKGYEREIW